jgi:very-short-patch-repair endonuclease
MRQFKQRTRKFRASQTSAEFRLWQALRNRKLEGVLEMLDRTLRPS